MRGQTKDETALQKLRSTARTRIQKSKVAAKKGALIDTAYSKLLMQAKQSPLGTRTKL